MKNFIMTITLGMTALMACNNNNNVDVKKNSDTALTAKTEVTTVTVNGTSVKDILTHYLHVKNALAKDNGKEAANGGNALMESFAKFDESSLTADQKKAYQEIAGDAKEHAEHIGKNGDKVDHQREHFALLSKDVYDLVKAIGAGQTLYQDFCPMYNNNKGAIWLSETKTISNPYLGAKMPTCGSVKETLQ